MSSFHVPAPSTFWLRQSLQLALLLAVSLTFLVTHLSFVPRTLDGIDSANFGLAVDQYDLRLHQPHPPGYPVHIALARMVTSTYRAFAPAPDRLGAAFAGLRILSALCASVAVFAVMWLAIALGFGTWRAVLVAALTASCPLFWVMAMRPMSDAPGLLFAMVAQGLALSAFNQSVDRAELSPPLASRAGSSLRWIASGMIAGIAMGVRFQTGLLTLPLLAVLLALRVHTSTGAPVRQTLLACVGGVLAWIVPTVIAVGGAAEYVRLLIAVGADDLRGVEMLATHPTLRLLAAALSNTFVVPWGSPALGWSAVALAVLGIAALASHNRLALGLAAVMTLPYLAFHLLFQESASIRYALPLVPLTSFLIVANAARRRAWVFATLVVLMASAAVIVSARAAAAYRKGGPVADALADMRREAGTRTRPPTLAFHHSVGRVVRAAKWPGQRLRSPVRYEWRELAEHWLAGNGEPIWFVADARRTDLALIDPASRRLLHAYEWRPAVRTLLRGSNPVRVNWYEITAPGWFLMEGWALTPETRGVASRDQQGPGLGGIVGYIRRRSTPAIMMIGGRNLGGPCDTAASIDVLVDGRRRASWTAPTRTPFLETIAFAPGELAGDGEFATLTVVAHETAPANRLVDVAVEDFDVQSPGFAIAGFEKGWYMPELNPSNGLSWRWMDRIADLRVEAFNRDVELVLKGESPLRYFQEAPRVVVRAAATTLAEFHPDADFEWTVRVPATVLAAAGGRLTIESDRSFVPDEMSGNGDTRQLALRIYNVKVRALPANAKQE